jgi:hypothetical protein
MKRLALVIALFSISAGRVYAGPCDAVLNPEVFNAGSTSATIHFASNFKHEFCQTKWTSSIDLHNRATNVGYTDKDASSITKFDFNDASNDEKRNAAYDAFCKKSDQELAYSSAFYNDYRSSDKAVDAWRACVGSQNQSEGHFAAAIPSPDLTGATIILLKKSAVAVEGLKIFSIQPAGAYEVDCRFGGNSVVGATIPASLLETAITCTKAANTWVKFSINSNWGSFSGFEIPGYNETLSSLQLDVANARQSVADLEGQVADLRTSLGALKSFAEQNDYSIYPDQGGFTKGTSRAFCPADEKFVGGICSGSNSPTNGSRQPSTGPSLLPEANGRMTVLCDHTEDHYVIALAFCAHPKKLP